jgi:hypothetical protein
MSTRGYRVARLLGVLSIVATVLAGLALQDIYHAETDVTLEWRVLRVSFLIIVAFHAVALSALSKAIG